MTHPQDQASPPGPAGEPGAPASRRIGGPGPGLVPASVGLAALAFAALMLRPDHSLVGGGSGPIATKLAPTVLLIIGWLIGCFALTRYFRGVVLTMRGLPARTERLHEAALLLLRGAILTVPLLLFLTYHRSPSTHGPQLHFPPMGGEPFTGQPPSSSPDIKALLLAGLEIALVLLVVIGVAMFVWQWYYRPVPASFQPTERRPGEQEGLADAVDSGLRALHGADARAAVIACYAAMERSLGDSGIERQVADSPTDLLERAVADGAVLPDEVRVLTALFREARYSSHPMDASHLRQARAALDAIAAQLTEREVTR